MEGLIFRGAYLWREICVSKSIGLALWYRIFTIFALFDFVFEGNFQVQVPGGLIFGGVIKRRVFCVTSLGGLYLEGLIHGGDYFWKFTLTEQKEHNAIISLVKIF